jgi:hypothetical protein
MMVARIGSRGLILAALGCGLLLTLLGFLLVGRSDRLEAADEQGATSQELRLAESQANPTSEGPGVREKAFSRDRPLTRPRRSFASYMQELVDLGCQLWERLEQNDEAGAEVIDAEIRGLYREMIEHLPGTDEIALHERTLLAAEDPDLRAQVHRQLLNRLIRDGLAARWEKGKILGQRQACDQFARDMLVSLSKDALIAEDLGRRMLVDAPYLGAAQEREVMDLIELSVQEEFLVPVASALLLTTWHNMEERGERSSSGIDSLALILKDDSNPAKRLAALEYLLASGSQNLIDLVLDLAARRQDQALARQLAHCAANQLEPALALQVLLKLVDMSDREMISPFMILAARDSGVLRRAYEERLGNQVDARLRAELITGCGFSGTPESLELAEIAFNLDPDPEVFSRSLFVLSAKAAPEHAEACISKALEDPRIARDPARIGSLVLCLQNLGQRGEYNALHRLAERIRALPGLLPEDRQEMGRILQRFLPQGISQPRISAQGSTEKVAKR